MLWKVPFALLVLGYLGFICILLFSFWWTDLVGPLVFALPLLWWALDPMDKRRRAAALLLSLVHILLQIEIFSGSTVLEPLVTYGLFRSAIVRKRQWLGWLLTVTMAMSFVLLSRTSGLYNIDTPSKAGAVDRQKGVRVLATVNDAEWMTHNVRFLAQDCDGKHMLVGASHGPMLIRFNPDTLKARWVLDGRSTDTLFLDCQRGLAFLGDYESHELYAVDTDRMKVVWTSPKIMGRTATIIGDQDLKMVVMAEDWGVSAWRVDYADMKRIKLFKYPFRDSTDPRYSRETGYLYFGGDKLMKVDPWTGKVLARVSHEGFPDPHLILDGKRNAIWVSNSLTGQVHQFDQVTLEHRGYLKTGLGARYLYFDEKYDALIFINYLTGELSAHDPDTGLKLVSRQVGRRGRVINESHDGKEIYVTTRVGLVAVERALWKH